MTLIVTINGRDSIWLLADRRLSYKGRAPKDDACKIMFLETKDGVAILGYAGLGATSLGTEPALWMSKVLRGINLPLEQSLGVLAEAIKNQLPRHLVQLPGSGGPAHNVFATAFLDDEVKLYTIDMIFEPNRKSFNFRYTRHIADKPVERPPRIGLGGSGAGYLFKNMRWIRPLLRLISAYDRGKITAKAVADHLAKLNDDVFRGVGDKSVGPRCIVAWRNRKSGFHQGGGGQEFYSKGTRDTGQCTIPTVVNGTDLNAIFGVILPHALNYFEAARSGSATPEFDAKKINAQLAQLPDGPDENLR